MRIIQDIAKGTPTFTKQPETNGRTAQQPEPKVTSRKGTNRNRYSSLNPNGHILPYIYIMLPTAHALHSHFSRLLQTPSAHYASTHARHGTELKMEPSPVHQWLDPGQKTFNSSSPQCHVGQTLGKERYNKGNKPPAKTAPKGWVCAICGKLNPVGNRGSCNVCTVCGRPEGVKLGAPRITAVNKSRAGLQQGEEKDSKSCTKGGIVDLLDDAERTKPLGNWKSFQKTRRKTEKATTDHLSLSAEIHKLLREVRN